MRYVRVTARVRPGEPILASSDGLRLLAWNLGRRKARFDSKLYAYRVKRSGITLLLGLPTPSRLPKIMHRIRILTTTEYNRSRGVVGKVRWSPGYSVDEIPRRAVAAQSRALRRLPGSKLNVDLDPPPRG